MSPSPSLPSPAVWLFCLPPSADSVILPDRHQSTAAMEVKTLMSVEYPGPIANLERFFTMIGGVENLEKVFNSGDRLSLHFRPEDIYCHPTYGDRQKVNQLLVRFKRKKITYSDGTVETNISADIVGIIDTSYVFQSLCDFQYLPMRREGDNYVSIVDDIIPSNPLDPTNLDNKEFNPNAPSFVLPAIFSRFDSYQGDYYYKDTPAHTDAFMSQQVKKFESASQIGRVRKSRGFLGHVVSFDSLGTGVPIDVPPHLEETAESSVSAEVREKIIASFAKRPIWNRVSLLYETGASFNEVKYILPTVAYYFQDNPFRACWVRLGYDFRKDKESRRYQVIDFRLRKSYGNKRVDTELLKAKRTIYQYQLPLQKGEDSNPRVKRFQPSIQISQSALLESATEEYKQREEARKEQRMQELVSQIFFKRGVIPCNRQIIYHLQDIDLEEVQQMLIPVPDKDAPDEKDGWLPSGSIDKIRSLMTKEMDATIITVAKERGYGEVQIAKQQESQEEPVDFEYEDDIE